MFAFASPIPSAFVGIDAVQPYSAPRQSTEEEYLRTLAEEHERTAALARQRLQEVRHRQQQHELEAELRLQQQLVASLQARTPMRSPYQPRTRLGRALPDVLFDFDTEGQDASDDYAELVHRRSQAAMVERQKRAEEQIILCALFEEQRRTEAERVANLQRRRAEQVKVEHERIIRAQRERAQMAEREQARRHLAARAEQEKLKAFFEALVSAMSAEKEEGAELERKNAIRRSSVPAPVPAAPIPDRAPASAPSLPKASAPAPRAPSPSPSVASDTSEASLHSISHLQDKYDSLRSSFEFPATLSFAPSTNSPASTPNLLFNPTNAPVHTYEHALTGLLTELDAVESFGDEHVRDVRRSLARQIESELESLEEKKREIWRKQSEPALVESLPVVVESMPAPAPVEVQSSPAPVESAPAPTPAPALPTTIDPADPLAWLAARLAQSSDSEDSEVKAVREGLASRLAESVVESPGDVAVEQPEAVTAEQSESRIVDEPESLESFELTVTPQCPSLVAEPQAEPESATIESIEIIVKIETHTSTELASPTPVPASASAAVLVAEPEIKQLAHTTEPEVQSPTTPTTDSVVAGSESGSEPEVLAAPESELAEPEPTKFVQVSPDSDSDEDLVSELADRKSTSGADEFETL